MRRPKFISPSALQTWKQNEEEYFLKYLADDRPPLYPQTKPMSVGSAFDAYIKAFLHLKLFGRNHKNSAQFDFDTIFKKQVEPENRDWALNAGAHCFLAYKKCGALGDIVKLLERAAQPPQMEFTAVGTVVEEDGVFKGIAARVVPEGMKDFGDPYDNGPVVILGKPDLAFVTEQGVKVILDWKVNGFCSKNGAGPAPGYICILGDHRKHGEAHKDAVPWFEGDLQINSVPNLEEKKKDWATQLTAYAWICGVHVGEEVIVAVDQLACKPHMPDAPRIAIAQHRCNITPGYQEKVFAEFQTLWDIVHSDHIFRGLTLEESQARCEQLNNQAAAFRGKESKHAWLREISGRTGRSS